MRQHYTGYNQDKQRTIEEMNKPRTDKPIKLSSLSELSRLEPLTQGTPIAYTLRNSKDHTYMPSNVSNNDLQDMSEDIRKKPIT